jgi:serine/threonine protein kinase/tetratricopeptide (TPR) repeat protein
MTEPEETQRSRAAFAAGEVLCGRFEIVRFIARGGTGEVYEAEDMTLRARVALKALRPELAADERVVERFRREILFSRQVTHPHVCRVYDVFQHVSSARPQDPPRTFLTMELLQGQSLAERIASAGPMTTAEALPLAMQIASGLAAAHRAGIVHRDFKSGNVMLVPTERDGLRAVITDFGLAHSLRAAEDSGASLTGSGGLVGTLAYMAPEQLESGDVTTAADIYAFGVVLYELVTGRRPFVGDSPLVAAVRRLKESPVPPGLWKPGLDESWEAVILRCLERDPTRRPTRPEEVVAGLMHAERPQAFAVSAGNTHRRAWTSILALAGLLVWTSATLPRRGGEPPVAGAAGPSPAFSRRSVAVLGFRNLSQRPDTAWLSTALSETLRSELSMGERLRMIPGEEVARARIDLPIGEVDSLGRDSLQRVRNHLGVDLVVLGSYLDLGKDAGGRIRFDLCIQDAGSGATIASFTEGGTEERIFDLVSRTGERLRQRLGISELTVAASTGAFALPLPATPEALRLYSEGVARLRELDALEARKLLEGAVAADPSYFPARVALSEAWSALGYQAKALDEAKHAYRLVAAAGREQRLSVEGRFREAGQEWGRAVDTYRTLCQLFPDDVDHGLRLAAAQRNAGQIQDSLATLERLRGTPGPSGTDLRIDIEAARAYMVLTDYKRMQGASRAAVDRGMERGTRQVVAKALLLEGQALEQLGQIHEAGRRLEEARDIYARGADRGGVASTLQWIGATRLRQGDPVEAEAALRQALDIYVQIGDQRGAAGAYNVLGLSVRRQGRIPEALQLLERSLAAYREIGDRRGVARELNNRAGILREQGDFTRATQLYDEALTINRELGSRGDVSLILTNLAYIRRERGDLEGSKKGCEEALAMDEEGGLKSQIAADRFDIAELLLLMGRTEEARREHGAALALREELGEKLSIAQSRLALAIVSLEEGDAENAESPAREAAALFHQQKAADHEAAAQGVLARVLLAEDKLPQARQAIARAAAITRTSQVQAVRLPVAIAGARVTAASGQAGDAAKALKSLERTLQEARRTGRVPFEFEARLALGEVGLRAARPGAAEALAALEKEASTKGYGLIARKAAAARQARTALNLSRS